MPGLTDDLQARLAAAGEALKTFAPTAVIAERGVVEGAGDGIVIISGLPSARLDELLAFDNDRRAVVVSLDRRVLHAVMLDPAEGILAGMSVRGTGAVVQVPLGPALQGRIVDPLARPLDAGLRSAPNAASPFSAPRRQSPTATSSSSLCSPVSSPSMRRSRSGEAKASHHRRPEHRQDLARRRCHPQSTALGRRLRLRRGWAEALGRSSRHRNNSPGWPVRALHLCHRRGRRSARPAVDRSYAACTMAEEIRDRGGHALLVIDDMRKHAAIHRQILLLLCRPPGRALFLVNIFNMT